MKKLIATAAGTRLSLPPAMADLLARWRRAVDAPPSDLVVVEESEGAIRATRITRRRGAAPAIRTVARAIPAELEPSERRDRERAALGSIVSELDARGKPAIAALAGSDVIVRRLTMPRMKPSDLKSALELECRKYVNYPLENAEFRYEVLKGIAADAAGIPVVVTIAPRQRVDRQRSLLLAAGLRPWSITLPAAGLRADLERRGELPANEVVAYLDIGRDASQIVVLKGRDLRFSRDLAIGLTSMATALRQIVVPGVGTLERTPEAAETLLLEHGIPIGVDEAQFADGVPLAAVSIMLRPTLERLVRELWNSFDYCNEQFLGESVARVVLLGPGRGLRNLENYLSGVLKMPVTAADAGTGRGSRDLAGSDQPGSGVAAALASVSRETLNFVRGDDAAGAVGWLAEAVPAPAVAAVAALLVVSIALPTELNVARVRSRVSTLHADLNRLSAQSEAVARFRAAREEEGRLRALLSRLTGSQVVWSSVFRDLSHRVGPNVRLTLLEVVEPPAASGAAGAPAGPATRSLRITGLLQTQGSSPERVLADLLRSLGASPAFDQVRLEGCERVSSGLSSFTVSVRLAEGYGS